MKMTSSKTFVDKARFTLLELLTIIAIAGVIAGWLIPAYRAGRNVALSRMLPVFTKVDVVIPFDGKYLVSLAPTKGQQRITMILPGNIMVEGMSLHVKSVHKPETAPKGHMALWFSLDDNDEIIAHIRASEYNRAPIGWVIMPVPVIPPIEIR